MTTSDSTSTGGQDQATVVAISLLAGGLGLAAWGAYQFLTLSEKLRLGRCDGCEPFHPLVIAPLLVGTAAILIAGHLLYRR